MGTPRGCPVLPVPAAEPWCCGRPAAAARRAAPTGSPGAGSCGACAGSRWLSPALSHPAALRGNWDQLRAPVWRMWVKAASGPLSPQGQGMGMRPSLGDLGFPPPSRCPIKGTGTKVVPAGGAACHGPPISSRRILMQQSPAELRGRHEHSVGQQEIPQQCVWKRADSPAVLHPHRAGDVPVGLPWGLPPHSSHWVAFCF